MTSPSDRERSKRVQDCWYGDNRDVVKWGALLQLAREYGIPSILQIAFYRSSDPLAPIIVDGVSRPIAQEVWDHFRSIHRIKSLGKLTGLQIRVFEKEFTSQRQSYIREAKEFISDSQLESKLVFLDPDTGIAPPSGGGLWHIRPDELFDIYTDLRPGDLLVLYQHARRDKNWLTETHEEFARSLSVGAELVRTVTHSKFRDVAFFSAIRQG